MVTVWSRFQFDVVKVRLRVGAEVEGELPPRRSPSVVSVAVTGIVTVAVGCMLSRTVKVSFAGVAEVEAVVLLTVMPGMSLSLLTTAIGRSGTFRYIASMVNAIDAVIV